MINNERLTGNNIEGMLDIKNISKSFHQRGLVLDNLSLHVNEGDSFAITGPSGSGKTTLMNIIGLLDKPDSGDVIFKGNSILSYASEESAFYRNRNIGFVFQDHLLLPHLTVKENILLPILAVKNKKNEFEEKENHVIVLMKSIGIQSLIDKYPFQISGGEAQRVTLVRALVNKPSILLADEPTGSLDAKNAEILGNLLLDVNAEFGLSLILATHSEELAGKMNHHLKLVNGKLIG
ncbi:MAG: ATP-binding protein [Odoribacter sp.]|nr:ATP-binding protein [Odoribacter sp.]